LVGAGDLVWTPHVETNSVCAPSLPWTLQIWGAPQFGKGSPPNAMVFLLTPTCVFVRLIIGYTVQLLLNYKHSTYLWPSQILILLKCVDIWLYQFTIIICFYLFMFNPRFFLKQIIFLIFIWIVFRFLTSINITSRKFSHNLIYNSSKTHVKTLTWLIKVVI
jgi:hypothetical protein